IPARGTDFIIMYNLHCHSLLSDGSLLPSEVAARYLALGYKAIAITDHVDYSNIEVTVKAVLEFVRRWPKDSGIKVFSGIELTHLPPSQFKPLVKYARDKGIAVIVGHGETLVEPVVKDTNRAAIEAGIDILAHPGLITDADVKLAKEKNIFLEVTSRKGHSSGNVHVVERALELGAKLILDTDSHEPEDIISPEELRKAGLSAGIPEKKLEEIYKDVRNFLDKKEGAS
ncbi:MAG: histidinol phosphate phosphatase domain-containing protein, partial [Candidatus Omnitrophica bacterium]|nr:histidinol phosphate phosphatase domain-containing protein [Candidatus Omnitrophota bacterium]